MSGSSHPHQISDECPITPRRLLAVTGANGYIGRRLCAAASAAGWPVLALARRPSVDAGFRCAPYDLGRPLPVDLLTGVSAVIHLAANTASADPDPQIELRACQNLIEACRDAGARLVLVSSQTAAEKAPTGYGRLKWRLEQLVIEAGGTVIRPGMVYGGPEAGLFGNLCGLVRRLPVMPALFWPTPIVQPIHVDDLSTALVAAATSDPAQKSLYEIADPHPISLAAFLRMIARERIHKRRLFLPIPSTVLTSALAGVFRLSRNAAIDPARLNSLLAMKIMNSGSCNAEFGISPRDIADGMHPSGSRRRRDLIREGRSLIRYLSGADPARALIARYVRVLERFDGGKALELPPVVHTWPALLWLIEGPRLGGHDVHIARRINIAFQIAEASILTRNFQLARQVAWPLAVLRLAVQLAKELTGAGLRSIAGHWLHSAPNSSNTVDR
jgi:uncharacterized protein YbjT (DUF2867 family)